MHGMSEENTTVYFTEQMGQLADVINLSGVSDIAGHDVPVKLHMGEPGNPYII